MTIEEALPVEGGGEAVPGVGIFWGLRAEADARTILSVGVSLTEAEAYGDCLTYPGGHHDVWEAWRRLPPAELQRRGLTIALREHEYDAVPRGRIVYEVGAARFILYADRRLVLDDPATGSAVELEAFGPTNMAVFAGLLPP